MTLLTALAVGGLAAGAAGLFVAVLAYARVLRLRAEWGSRPRAAEPVPDVRSSGSVDPRAIRNVAMLRYDAFRDMGGRLSFSLALLDVAGDGVVLTSINAPSETRTYAKIIQGGQSTHDLSPEEQQVLDEAQQGQGTRVRATDGQGTTDGHMGRQARTR